VSERKLRISGQGGRKLDVELAGPGDGIPLIFHHGTPGAAVMFAPMVAAGAERGIRHISYSRPGYGSSDRRPGRSVADCAQDVQAIADELGLERFLTAGWSGGGPHALACAALLAGRTLAAASLAGPAPLSAAGLDWTAGMGEENIQEFEAARAGERPLRLAIESARDGTLAVGAEELHSQFESLLSEVDRDTLTGEFAEFLTESMQTGLAESASGWVDDTLAFVKDWGVDLDSIETPVQIWHGGKDLFVPYAHGEWLAENVSGARAELFPEHGHLSLVVGEYGLILDTLLGAAGLAGAST